jgi:hypothetical protein
MEPVSLRVGAVRGQRDWGGRYPVESIATRVLLEVALRR